MDKHYYLFRVLCLMMLILLKVTSYSCASEIAVLKEAEDYCDSISDFNDVFHFDADSDFQIIDGVLFVKDTLWRYPALKIESDYIVPEGTQKIDINAFVHKREPFSNVYLPDSCIDIGFSTDYRSIWGEGDRFNTKNYHVSDTHPLFAAQDGVLFSKDMKTLLLYPSRGHEHSYTVPEGVEKIGEYAFQGADIDQIILPDTITEIREGAFYGSNIQEIELNEGLTVIGNRAFLECKLMASPTLPSSLKRIDSEAFSCCFEINSITLPDGIEILDTFVFWATPLKELVLPKSLIFIGDDICVWDSPNNTPLYLVYADTYGQTWAEDSKVLYRILE